MVWSSRTGATINLADDRPQPAGPSSEAAIGLRVRDWARPNTAATSTEESCPSSAAPLVVPLRPAAPRLGPAATAAAAARRVTPAATAFGTPPPYVGTLPPPSRSSCRWRRGTRGASSSSPSRCGACCRSGGNDDRRHSARGRRPAHRAPDARRGVVQPPAGAPAPRRRRPATVLAFLAIVIGLLSLAGTKLVTGVTDLVQQANLGVDRLAGGSRTARCTSAGTSSWSTSRRAASGSPRTAKPSRGGRCGR